MFIMHCEAKNAFLCKKEPVTMYSKFKFGGTYLENTSYVSLSGLATLQRQVAISANNMANSSTAGFKAERSVFQEYVEKQSGADTKSSVSFVLDSGSFLDPRSGSLEMTRSQFDIAIQGDGWFGFQSPDGQIGLGRNGQLVMDDQGRLTTASGHHILDIGGAPISLPPDVSEISIARDGTISTAEGDTVGLIGVFRGADIQSYRRIAGGMFVPPQGGTPDLEQMIGANIVQGAIEGSNVNAVTEMTQLIEAQRGFQRAINSMTSGDTLLKETLTRLGRAS